MMFMNTLFLIWVLISRAMRARGKKKDSLHYLVFTACKSVYQVYQKTRKIDIFAVDFFVEEINEKNGHTLSLSVRGVPGVPHTQELKLHPHPPTAAPAKKGRGHIKINKIIIHHIHHLLLFVFLIHLISIMLCIY